MTQGIRFIVGLGNPGARYAKTRHNVGFWLADELARRDGQPFKAASRFHGETAEVQVDGRRCWLLKPATYVNRSGQAARAFLHFHKIPVNEMLVVHDDLDLPPGKVKLKLGGGHGGHNGLRDLLAVLGDDGFYRARVGIGHPGHRDQVTDYVLGTPSPDDRQAIMDTLDAVLDSLPDMAAGRMDKATQRLHTK